MQKRHREVMSICIADHDNSSVENKWQNANRNPVFFFNFLLPPYLGLNSLHNSSYYLIWCILLLRNPVKAVYGSTYKKFNLKLLKQAHQFFSPILAWLLLADSTCARQNGCACTHRDSQRWLPKKLHEPEERCH